MARKFEGHSWKKFAAAGTTTLKDTNCVVRAVVLQGTTAAGTAVLYDSSSGTAANKDILTIANNTELVPNVVPLDANCSDGLVVAVMGTPNIVVIYD